MEYKITEDEVTDLLIKLVEQVQCYTTDTGYIMENDEGFEIEINKNQYRFLNYVKKELEKHDS